MNGLILGIRFLTIVTIFFSFFYFVPLELTEIISITSVIGIVIGFASSEILVQMISGFYILTSKPFRVNELVQIDNTIGRVMEIGINFTVIQRFDGSMVKIPNRKVIDSRIRNFTKSLTKDLLKKQYHQDKTQRKRTILLNWVDDQENDAKWIDNISEIFLELEVTRYTFDIELELALNPKLIFKSLDAVCAEYSAIFDFTPKYMVFNTNFRVIFRFRIYCTQAAVIMNNFPLFIADIAEAIYGSMEGTPK
jgi:small-conductance mechanosensitive channel